MEQTSTPELTNAAQSDHAHPRIDYVRIFAWLAGFTVIEREDSSRSLAEMLQKRLSLRPTKGFWQFSQSLFMF